MSDLTRNDIAIQILELIGELHYGVTPGQGMITIHTPEGDQTFFVNVEQGMESQRHILHWLQAKKASHDEKIREDLADWRRDQREPDEELR